VKLSDSLKFKPLTIAALLAMIAAILAMLPGFPWVVSAPAKDRWPVGDGDTAYPVISTYGQFEKYADTLSDYHDGIDIAVSAPPSGEDVVAIESGTVADYYTAADPVNFSLVVLSDDDPTSGYYYVHFDPAVSKGDAVAAGALLGTTVGYKDASGYDHVHVSRVQTIPGSTDTFPYKFVGNPLARLKDAAADTTAPSVGAIFCFDQGSGDRIDDPDELVDAKVDVVAEVSDLHDSSSDRLLIPYRVNLEITEKSSGDVVHTGELEFDGEFDTARIKFVLTAYKDAGDSGVELKGGYDDRQFFVVPTNALPDVSSDHWSTTGLDSGDYVIRVIATDVAGNAGENSITVTLP